MSREGEREGADLDPDSIADFEVAVGVFSDRGDGTGSFVSADERELVVAALRISQLKTRETGERGNGQRPVAEHGVQV